MDVDGFWVPLPSPFVAIIFEVSNELLLFRIARNHGLTGLQEDLCLLIDIVKLRISISVLSTLVLLFA